MIFVGVFVFVWSLEFVTRFIINTMCPEGTVRQVCVQHIQMAVSKAMKDLFIFKHFQVSIPKSCIQNVD